MREDLLHCLDGRISGLFVDEGQVEFVVAGQKARLSLDRMTRSLRDGDRVRLVLGDSLFDQHTVLALNRISDGTTTYLGPSIGWKTVLLSGVACAVGAFLPSVWLVLLAILPVLVLHLVFVRERARIIQWMKARAWAHEVDEPPVPVSLPAAGAAAWDSPILEFTHDAIIIWEMGRNGIVYWNRAAERLYGYSREQARGRITHELLQTQIEGGIEELEGRLERYGIWVGMLRHTRKDGQEVHVEGRLSLMSQEHRPWLVLEVNRDVTDRERAELERTQVARQLRRLRGVADG